jgi:EpsI family protein
MRPLAPWRHFSPAIMLIAATAAALHACSVKERVPQHRNFDSFPALVGSWIGNDVPLSHEEVSVLGDGDFLLRDYKHPGKDSMNLFLAYYSTQRTGDTIHSPRNCLPGSGWTPLKAGRLQVRRGDGTSINVNRYVVGRGADRMLVLYWYQAHGRITASEYWAKIFMVSDSIRMNRSDGALVRIATSVSARNGEQMAEDRSIAFAEQVLPLLDSHIPR